MSRNIVCLESVCVQRVCLQRVSQLVFGHSTEREGECCGSTSCLPQSEGGSVNNRDRRQHRQYQGTHFITHISQREDQTSIYIM